MLQNLLLITLFLPLSFCSKQKDEVRASVSFASLFKEKCGGLPFRSKFILDSMTCYVSLRSNMDCSDVMLTYGTLKKGVASSDRQKLKAVGITDEGNSKICGFKFQGACDSGENIQDWCYTVVQKKRTFNDAAEYCEKKGQTLTVLHNDMDVQRLLKATIDLKSEIYWIGAGTVGSIWEFHDYTQPDFFRLKLSQTFGHDELGMVFQSKSKKDGYSGYSRVNVANKKFPFICSSPINNEYSKKSQINRYPRPETTTTTTTKPTTRYPKIENPKDWITDPIKGQQIYRSYNSKFVVHHYNLNPVNNPEGFTAEKTPGFVVTEQRYPELEGTCPELVKVGIWKYLTMSYIGNNPPAQFTLSESFYCAPRQLYCGANFQLRRVDKVKGGDIFYASDDAEANQLLSAQGPAPANYRAERGYFLESPCWIWQNYVDTNNTIAKAGGGLIWSRTDDYQHFQWSYSLDIYEAPLQESGFGRPGPGYVILEELYEAYFKEKCPELVPMRVWHGSNGGYEYNTWFGADGQPPAPHLNKKVYQETRKFYCAPRKDYCGADFLLRRCDITVWKSGFNPQSWYPENDYWERQQVLWSRKQEVCYVWQMWK